MAKDLLRSIKKLHQRTRQEYDLTIYSLQQELARLIAVRDSLPPETDEELARAPQLVKLDTSRFAINDIKDYLKEQGKPCLQADIVRVVGSRRRLKYPALKRPYQNVWKSLETHHRYRKEVVAVKRLPDGRIEVTKLQPKPRQEKIRGGKEDRPEYYKTPENLFYLKSEIKTFRYDCQTTELSVSGAESIAAG